MQITPSSGLAPDEIDRLIIEAETSVEKDKELKDLIMLRNRLDSLIKNTRRAMAEYGKSLESRQQIDINTILGEAEECLASDDPAVLDDAFKKAEEAANQLTTLLMVMA
jgi:molecular chaperone DnaK (HSP70)